MKRLLFHVGAGVSLLLCVAMVALWARSYYEEDFLWYGWHGSLSERAGVITEPGRVRFFWDDDGNGLRITKWRYTHWAAREDGSVDQPEDYYTVYWNRWKFAFWTDRYEGVLRGWDFGVPHWFLAILLALWPAWWCLTVRRRRRQSSFHLCRKCGYDLRAHQPDQQCPECGTVIPQATPSTK